MSAERTTAPLPRIATDGMRRLELALTKPDPAVVAKVNAALGYPADEQPRAHLGETATYLTVWSQRELNDLYLRVGGTVTLRQVERRTSDGSSTWTATEITLTVDVDGVGPVEVVTDIEDDPEHGYRTDLPVIAVARYVAASRHCQALAEAAGVGELAAAHGHLVLRREAAVEVGGLDLIEAA
jgi:hypothetical protein